MDRLHKTVAALDRAVQRLEEALQKVQQHRGDEDYAFYRDAAIQRFEFTFEIFWKALKIVLEYKGIICRSPRSCIREFFAAGYISEEHAQRLLEMVEAPSLTVYAYQEDIAENVVRQLPGYVPVLQGVLTTMRKIF